MQNERHFDDRVIDDVRGTNNTKFVILGNYKEEDIVSLLQSCP